MSSSTSHATVTYTSMSSDDDYLAPSDDVLELAKAQPLPAYVSPTVLLPDYSADFEPIEEDLEKDPKKEPEENPEEEPFEEEDPLAPIISASALLAQKMVSPHTPLPSSFDAHIEAWHTAPVYPLPPPSLLSPLSFPLPKIPSAPLLLPPPTRKDIILEANMPPQKGARFTAPSYRFEIRESSAAAAARQPGFALARGCPGDRAVLRARISSLELKRRYHRARAIAAEQESTYAREA
ncbi:hypothetical protein Tco_1091243 [Tanacetum coccineum]|uniref:Uncharacterized protein n=1 Tax=Tanacetum coccineum TaxID=301880 RepID=A0ABQ5I6N2_9ASTR